MPQQQVSKAMLNTTIRKEVLDRFREACKASNIPMNTVLEIFMSQFSDGCFSIKIAKNQMQLEIDE